MPLLAWHSSSLSRNLEAIPGVGAPIDEDRGHRLGRQDGEDRLGDDGEERIVPNEPSDLRSLNTRNDPRNDVGGE